MPTTNWGLVQEPIEGDSLTQFLRSMTNSLASSGTATQQSGKDILSSGLDLTGKGTALFDQPISYWGKLLSGDQQAMTEAVAPEAGVITSQFDTARRAATNNMRRGGYRSTTLAEMPFQQAGKISDLYQTLRPQAASQLGSLAAMLSSIGINIGQLGLGEEGEGTKSLLAALQGLLERRGQNVQEHGQSMNMATQLLASLI